MDILQTTAKAQSTQMHKEVKSEASSAQTQAQSEAIQKAAHDARAQRAEMKEETRQQPKSEDQMKDLVKQLNSALNPFHTSLRFGFDNSSDVFYVSVIETQTNKMIRRFPAEAAFELLPKVQELNGILFDEKG